MQGRKQRNPKTQSPAILGQKHFSSLKSFGWFIPRSYCTLHMPLRSLNTKLMGGADPQGKSHMPAPFTYSYLNVLTFNYISNCCEPSEWRNHSPHPSQNVTRQHYLLWHPPLPHNSYSYRNTRYFLYHQFYIRWLEETVSQTVLTTVPQIALSEKIT